MRDYRWIAALVCAILLVASLPSWGAEAEEPHYSWMHFVVNLLPEGTIPTPHKWHQPDLIPNTYLVVVALSVFFVLATRRLEWIPKSRLQNMLEMVVESLTDFFGGILGEEGRRYAPYVGSIFLFILCLNLLGLIPGFQAPTADLNTTLALGVTAVLGVQVIAIRETGLGSYVRHFVGDPWWLGWLNVPLHLIGEVARALSLSVRLFGNIFGEETVIVRLVAMGMLLAPLAGEIPWIPVQFPMMLFAIFGSLIQALVFSILTSIYIVTFISHHEEGHSEEAH